MLAAVERADIATDGKLAMEQELRKWREENMQRRRAGEALKLEAKHSSAVVIMVECKEDGCAFVHPLSDLSKNNTPDDSASLVTTKKATKKLWFFPRVIMFFARRRLRPHI